MDSGYWTPCEVGQQNLLGLVDVDENYLRTGVFSMCVAVQDCLINICCLRGSTNGG